MSLGEFDIIARYFTRPTPNREVLLGVGDDAAVLDVRTGCKLVVAMDTLVEAVHFPAGTDAAEVGYRALAVNLSDLAAMGAQPAWMTLSLSLPQADERWLEGFASGLFELAQRYDVALVGGDTVRGPTVVTIQVAGWVEPQRWLSRAGARPGDLLMISGVPGEAAGGLMALQQSLAASPAAEHLIRRFHRPEPRLALGRGLRGIASAAMDVSDGVLADLQKLCAASECAAQLDVDALPGSTSLRALFDAETCLRLAMSGGDDYELLFTVPADRLAELAALDPQLALTRIGVMQPGRGVRCLRHGQAFQPPRAGFDHFAPQNP
jgi:thiamine-monophosphate kinase